MLFFFWIGGTVDSEVEPGFHPTPRTGTLHVFEHGVVGFRQLRHQQIPDSVVIPMG